MFFRKIFLATFCLLSSTIIYASGVVAELQPLGDNYHPDFPLNSYAAGQLGMVKPTFATSYLLVAYRYLSHNPLTKEQQQTALTAWENYFYRDSNIGVDYSGPINFIDASKPDKNSSASDSKRNAAQWIKNTQTKAADYLAWRTARLAALGLPQTIPTPDVNKIDSPLAVDSFYQDLANTEDNVTQIYPVTGFNNLVLATQRLQAVKKALDQADKEKKLTQPVNTLLETWVSAQQQIFQRSDESLPKARTLLAQLPNNLPSLVLDDVAYSIASSYFYSEDSQEVKKSADLFAQLATHTNYPWHSWAAYLQYRALNIAANRNKQANDDCDVQCKIPQQQALQGMQALAQTASDPHLKAAATDYIRIMNMQRGAADVYKPLLERLNSNFSVQDFSDFILLSEKPVAGTTVEFGQWLELANRNDDDDGESFNKIYQHWQSHKQNFAWLWLVTTQLKFASDAQQKEILTAIQAIPINDAAYFPINIALIDQMANLKTPFTDQQQRSMIDIALKQLPPGEQFSTTTSLLNQRVLLAQSLPEFIQYAFFFPQGNTKLMHPADIKGLPLNYITSSAVDTINSLPMSVLYKLAAMPELPANYRPAMYANLWTRAVLLGDKKMAEKAGAKAAQFNPVLKDTMEKMHTAKDDDARETVFLTTLLTYPNLTPFMPLNLYQTWNGFNTEENLVIDNNDITLKTQGFDSMYNNFFWSKCTPRICKNIQPAFLTTAEIKASQEEFEKLSSLDTGSTFIANELSCLAYKHPTDMSYAELLASAIEATHYTNGDSRRAFATLKKLYPRSKAAKQTKYYYKSYDNS
jgi:hypothetical protein